MKMDSSVQTYATSDLGLASFLHCLGFQLKAIDRQNPRRCDFVFILPADKASAVSGWQNGTAKVNALAFWTSYQTLKGKVFRDE